MPHKINMTPIGIIHSPYREHDDIPIQGRFQPDVQGWVELEKEYETGLRDLGAFSYAILLYHFHRSYKVTLTGQPFLENEPHGIFAVRSPHRPNHIGFSVIKIKSIQSNVLHFTNVDMLDGTPLLDIKPYISYFDSFNNGKCGWIDKHFAHGKIPKRAVHRNA
jgi:tRNA-Thr(GGU) m(6)t(6)A37 methyltransferase TsaA